VEQALRTNGALADHAAGDADDAFVTGLIARVDLRTGSIEMVNAGHVLPLLSRGSALTALDLHVDLPLGMFADSTYRSTSLSLEPGDRLVLLTDGMLERNVEGVDMASAIRDMRDLHPREMVRALADSALEAAGDALQDDATVLCLDWHGPGEQSRDSVSGADQVRASDPH
jgi:serine phosphatase RsbU (regulator of sigma subunit)